MNTIKELSTREQNAITLLPQHLLCMRCLHGGGNAEFMKKNNLGEKLRMIQENPDIHVTLVAAFDEVGAKTPLYFAQTPEERKRDLDVLQKLGLVPGDTRTARDLLYRVEQKIPSLDGVCIYHTDYEGVWTECALAHEGYYEKCGAITALRTQEEMRAHKIPSCKELENTNQIVIRPHHLLCTICYIGNDKNDIPLDEDNLYEMWVKIRENPDIPVLLTDGPGDCMICPPCHAFCPERGTCVAACHLRDRKKDLDTMLRLGLRPGDVLPARELITRIYRSISTTDGICAYGPNTAPEWEACLSVAIKKFEKGIERGVFFGADQQRAIEDSQK